jgi:hypothetical protein
MLGQPLYEGTWNFRRCKDRDPIYGLGQSSLVGVRSVAEGLRRSGHRRITWVTLRDDPVIYLSGKPCTPQGFEAYDERDEADVSRMEARLKQVTFNVY